MGDESLQRRQHRTNDPPRRTAQSPFQRRSIHPRCCQTRTTITRAPPAETRMARAMAEIQSLKLNHKREFKSNDREENGRGDAVGSLSCGLQIAERYACNLQVSQRDLSASRKS